MVVTLVSWLKSIAFNSLNRLQLAAMRDEAPADGHHGGEPGDVDLLKVAAAGEEPVPDPGYLLEGRKVDELEQLQKSENAGIDRCQLVIVRQVPTNRSGRTTSYGAAIDEIGTTSHDFS
jgi:hypothetical protein